ncbi:hypothetical protein HMPREF3038_00485 [Akkermansia sp. KLE1797]|nr:hypothetical protein HMPREF3038_00485 [Akkermansia sp. KLE1797]KXU55597.1 hypothetical protein HMPREF3039_00154 [Akkermansia sp. KLE1798]KZA05472.1 hypothetical protein HMPREF1326_00879 [Akkermansia sp. KLE1605]
MRGNTAGLYVKYFSSTHGESQFSLPSGDLLTNRFFLGAERGRPAGGRRSLQEGLERESRGW